MKLNNRFSANVVISILLFGIIGFVVGEKRLHAGEWAFETASSNRSFLRQAYQGTIGKADGDRCPMDPSCSGYAEQAIRKHGLLLGWAMTFDRFLHEGTEARRVANGVRYRGGRLRVIDEVEHNDFWWAQKNDPTRLDDFISNGHKYLDSFEFQALQQTSSISDTDIRHAGKTFSKIGSPSEAAVLFVILWTRTQDPHDGFYGALSLLEANQPAATVALVNQIINGDRLDNENRAIAFFIQGLAFFRRGLYDAAAESFDLAKTHAKEASFSEMARMHYIEAKLRADKWVDAVPEIENLRTSAASSIVNEIDEDLPWRNPALAGAMSAVLPGSGQIYCGRYEEGFWAFIITGVFAFASYEAFDRNLGWVGVATTFTGLSWYSGNIYGAINAAHKYNRRVKKNRIEDWMNRLNFKHESSAFEIMLNFDF